MGKDVLSSEYAIVACGTMRPELEHLKEEGFLDTAKIFYTTPGLHQEPAELARQLDLQISRAKKFSRKIIVVYGGKFCYINVNDPYDNIDALISRQQEEGYAISRVQAERCFDMLVSSEEREQLAAGSRVWWLTPGWILYRHQVFKGWDKAQANENFPKHDGGAILLDGLDFFNRYSEEHPEELLDYSDWMGLPIQPHSISLERLRFLLAKQR